MEIFVKIDGGIGRTISATGAVDEFAKRKALEGVKVNVVTSFPAIFNGMESLNRVYNIGMPYLYEDYISKGEFIEPEPYNHYLYYKDFEHISTVYNFILNGKKEFIQPKLIIKENEVEAAKAEIADIKKKTGKKVMLVQPWGSTGGIPNGDKVRIDESYRSFGLEFYKKLVERFKDEYFIASVQSAANFEGKNVMQFGLKDVTQFANQSITRVIAAIPFVDCIVTCDSFLHHASASLGSPVPTVVLWGGTSDKNIGYSEQHNIVPKREVLYEPNRVPHDRELYVAKNKGVNEFDESILTEIAIKISK